MSIYSSLSSGLASKTLGIGRDGADGGDDPPYVTGVDFVGDVDPRVEHVRSCVQQVSHFSCLVLHQRLDVTFFRELLALINCSLHCSV